MKKLTDRGERLDLASHLPKPVAPGQNFAATPLLASALAFKPPVSPLNLYLNAGQKPAGARQWQSGKLADLEAWREYFRQGTNYPTPPQPGTAAQDVLYSLGKYDAAYAELRAAAERPAAQFPVRWSDGPMEVFLPHLAMIKALSQAINLRALCLLAAGRADDALADLRISFKIISGLREEPVLISFLVQMALAELALQPVWEGIVRHDWNSAQLAALEGELSRLDFVADGARVLRGERAFGNVLCEQLIRDRHHVPRTEELATDTPVRGRDRPFLIHLLFPCWIVWRSQVLNNECQQDIIDHLDRAAANPRISPLLDPALTNAWHQRLTRHSPYNILARSLAPVMFRAPPKICRAQTMVSLARLACALERHRLANGAYPERLDALCPQFLKEAPFDPYTGQPFHYRPDSGGHFILYSVGANLQDDGGRAVSKASGLSDPDQGDLVWTCP